MNERPEKEKLSPAERSKARLNAYREMQQDIDFMVERLARMESKMESPGTQWVKEARTGESKLNDMPRAPGYSGDRLSDQVARKVELEEEIRMAVARERAEYEAIKLITAHMRRSDERAIIQFRYLDGDKWTEINEVIHGNREDFPEKIEDYLRQTFRKHGTALLSFAKAWDDLRARKDAVAKRKAQRAAKELRE